MERKNYLIEKLSKEENIYLKKVVTNIKNKYIRDGNYGIIQLDDFYEDYIIDEKYEITEKLEQALLSANNLQDVMSNKKLYKCIEALSLKEKTVLFSLYCENKSVNEVASDMGIYRETVWKIKTKAINNIKRKLEGGNFNV